MTAPKAKVKPATLLPTLLPVRLNWSSSAVGYVALSQVAHFDPPRGRFKHWRLVMANGLEHSMHDEDVRRRFDVPHPRDIEGIDRRFSRIYQEHVREVVAEMEAEIEREREEAPPDGWSRFEDFEGDVTWNRKDAA